MEEKGRGIVIRYDEPDKNGDVYKKGCFGNSLKNIAIVGSHIGIGKMSCSTLAHTIALRRIMDENPDMKIMVAKDMGESLGKIANVLVTDDIIPKGETTLPYKEAYKFDEVKMEIPIKTGKEKRREKRKKNRKKNKRY